MKISKAFNLPEKNIRITKKSKSSSAQKYAIKATSDQTKFFHKQQRPIFSRTGSPSRKSSKLYEEPLKPINKFSLIFNVIKNKKALTLSSKETHFCPIPQINKLNQNHKQKVSFTKNFHRSSLIQHLMRKDQNPNSKAEEIIKIKRIETEQNLQQQQIKSHTQKFQANNDFSVIKVQHKVYDLYQQTEKQIKPKLVVLQINPQFSLNFFHSKVTKDVEIQASGNNIGDKYFMQYMRMRQLKVQNFNLIESQQSKIKEILKSTVDFTQNCDDLVSAINNGPTDDREKRIYALSKDLADCQVKLKKAFEKVNLLAEKLEQYISIKVHSMNRKKANLFASIQNLVFATYTECKQQKACQKQQTFQRILSRVQKQLKKLKELVIIGCTYNTKTIMKFNDQIIDVRKVFAEYQNVQLQNRVLQYTLIKQIEKIPALMITIFGEGKNLEQRQSKESHMRIDDQIKDYMAAKCQQCYNMKKKIDFLQFQNRKIKPVFKSLEWLIRDCSKNQSCLSLL